MNDKVFKSQGEIENAERETKRVMKELSEVRFAFESGERFQQELTQKLKETERRLYDIHHEK